MAKPFKHLGLIYGLKVMDETDNHPEKITVNFRCLLHQLGN